VYEKPTKNEQIKNFDRLAWATIFGEFLTSRFNTMKRFGLEGCESFIPGIKACIDRLVDHGVTNVIMGMPHRGRLNVLTNVVRKPMEVIFAEFQGKKVKDTVEEWGNSGDVKYHLGTSYERKYDNGQKVKLTLLPNPSHLEAVDPILQGRVRCEQHYMDD
jgi:2-oxoglutarate dehydrogenase E1 component